MLTIADGDPWKKPKYPLFLAAISAIDPLSGISLDCCCCSCISAIERHGAAVHHCYLPWPLFNNIDFGFNIIYKPTLSIVFFYQSYIFHLLLLFLVQGLKLLLDGVLDYLPRPVVASNARLESKNGEKVPYSKKLNHLLS